MPPRFAATGSLSPSEPPVVFVLWYWHQPGYRERYKVEQVNYLAMRLRECHAEPCRIIVITDRPEGSGINAETFPIWDDFSDLVNPSGAHLPSCYRRLKIFAEETTDALGIARNQRVVSMDLDMVPIKDMVPLFKRKEDFLGWKVPGARHPQVFNGSLVFFRAGAHPHLWEEFDPIISPRITSQAGFFGSDQGWISYCMVGSGVKDGWDGTDGVHGYRAIRFPPALPRNARIVSFAGKWKPWHEQVRQESPWVVEYWPD